MKRSLMIVVVALFAFGFASAQEKAVKKEKVATVQVQKTKGSCCPGGKCATMKSKAQAKHENCTVKCCQKQDEAQAEKK